MEIPALFRPQRLRCDFRLMAVECDHRPPDRGPRRPIRTGQLQGPFKKQNVRAADPLTVQAAIGIVGDKFTKAMDPSLGQHKRPRSAQCRDVMCVYVCVVGLPCVPL